MSEKRGMRSQMVWAAAAVALAPALGVTPAGAQQLNDRWVTVVMQAEPPDLDGCQSGKMYQGKVVKQNVVETLIMKNPVDGSLQPRLATAWEQVDGNTWQVSLRPNVTFHDGTPFNAQTLKASLDRTMNHGLDCTDRLKVFSDRTLDVTVVDDLTVFLRTDKPSPILPTRLTSMSIVGPNTPADKLVLDPVGTGPYIFVEWQPGQQILLKRNEGYWGQKPQPEGARYIWRSDSSVRAAMIKVGEGDLAPIISIEDANDPELDRGYLNSETTFLRIDTQRPPLDDKRVRLALNYAFDREAVRGTLVPKEVINATQMVMPSVTGHNSELDKLVRPYDPEKARQLLAEAKADGVAVDSEIVLYGMQSSYPGATEVMEAVMGMYQGIGLNVKFVNLEPGLWNETNRKPFAEDRPPNLLQSSHDNNKGDAVFSVPGKYACDSPVTTFCDPSLDAWISEVSTLTGKERADGWRQIFRHAYEDIVGEVWMYHMVSYARVSKRINFTPTVDTGNEIHIEDITFK